MKSANHIEPKLFTVADFKVIQERYAGIFEYSFFPFHGYPKIEILSKIAENTKILTLIRTRKIYSKISKIPEYPCITLKSANFNKFGFIRPVRFPNLVNSCENLTFFLHSWIFNSFPTTYTNTAIT